MVNTPIKKMLRAGPPKPVRRVRSTRTPKGKRRVWASSSLGANELHTAANSIDAKEVSTLVADAVSDAKTKINANGRRDRTHEWSTRDHRNHVAATSLPDLVSCLVVQRVFNSLALRKRSKRRGKAAPRGALFSTYYDTILDDMKAGFVQEYKSRTNDKRATSVWRKDRSKRAAEARRRARTTIYKNNCRVVIHPPAWLRKRGHRRHLIDAIEPVLQKQCVVNGEGVAPSYAKKALESADIILAVFCRGVVAGFATLTVPSKRAAYAAGTNPSALYLGVICASRGGVLYSFSRLMLDVERVCKKGVVIAGKLRRFAEVHLHASSELGGTNYALYRRLGYRRTDTPCARNLSSFDRRDLEGARDIVSYAAIRRRGLKGASSARRKMVTRAIEDHTTNMRPIGYRLSKCITRFASVVSVRSSSSISAMTSSEIRDARKLMTALSQSSSSISSLSSGMRASIERERKK